MNRAPFVAVSPARPLRALARRAAAFVALAERQPTPNYHEVMTSVYSICAAIVECEAAGVPRVTVVQKLAKVRAIHARSPFVQRLQSWPRGYAGDFETVRYICAGENLATAGTVEYECERYALSRPIAQQHRNKVHHQAARILKTLFALPKRARILSLACGSCPDFELIAHCLPELAGRIVLNDSDEAALAFSSDVLAGVADRCAVVRGNVLKTARRLGQEGPFDLVLAGGLFDYLPARHAAFLVEVVRERLLAPGGIFFFTNIAAGNPYRPLIEYFGDWFLIERSENDVRAMCAEAGFAPGAVGVRRDETGLALLVEAAA